MLLFDWRGCGGWSRQSNGHSFIKFNPVTLQWCFFNSTIPPGSRPHCISLRLLWVDRRVAPWTFDCNRPFVPRLNDEGGWWLWFMFYIVSCVFEFGETSIGTNFGYRTCSNCFNGVVTESPLAASFSWPGLPKQLNDWLVTTATIPWNQNADEE